MALFHIVQGNVKRELVKGMKILTLKNSSLLLEGTNSTSCQRKLNEPVQSQVCSTADFTLETSLKAILGLVVLLSENAK